MVRQKLLHGDCPADIAAEKGNSTDHVHDPTWEAADEEGDTDGVNKLPAVKADIELVFEVGFSVTDEFEKVVEIVSSNVNTV
jgi:hypothetical protein